jgi:hypothetical protein
VARSAADIEAWEAMEGGWLILLSTYFDGSSNPLQLVLRIVETSFFDIPF